jgi:methyl-accepting chemotaxis protein
MSNDRPLDTRLTFIGVDETMRAALREAQPLVARVLPQVLDAFYARVAATPDAKKFFADEAMMRHAKEMQIRHWTNIVSGKFDDSYIKSVTRIGETHHRLGLEPRWYIGGYSFILAGLLRAIEMEHAEGVFNGKAVREKKAALQAAITKAAMLDMDFAISVYIERAEEARRAADDRAEAERKAGDERVTTERNATMNKLAGDFEKAIGDIINTVSSASSELETSANGMTKIADSTQRLSSVVASSSHDAQANVESVAGATEELAASVREISRQVQDSNRIAGEAVTQAQKTDANIGELSKAASRIGDVVKLITAIAEQTNLLALNATIEAARAGEAGKGFAVVASEVKALAAQTAKATEEIASQITDMQTATSESVLAINEIGGTIRRISEITGAIAAAVEEQGAATADIARNVQLAAQGTGEVVKNISEVSRGATDTGTASAQMLGSARSLAKDSATLRSEVANFLGSVRVA